MTSLADVARTTSAFAWLDYSDGERRRVLDVIDVVREKGTLYELGVGSIRDTFADRFFVDRAGGRARRATETFPHLRR